MACISPQLFQLQDQAYRDRICSEADRLDGMAVTNRAYKLMHDWVTGPIGETYSLSSDWDHRWRTGGTVEEVIDEAHLGPQHIIDGVTRYARARTPATGASAGWPLPLTPMPELKPNTYEHHPPGVAARGAGRAAPARRLTPTTRPPEHPGATRT